MALSCDTYELNAPTLKEVTEVLQSAFASNYASSSVEVSQCPDLRLAPFHLASNGLSGSPIIAEVGGPTYLFPTPLLDKKYSLMEIAQNSIQMSAKQGMLLGAGAGPFHIIGQNAELATSISWNDTFQNVTNNSHYTKIDKSIPTITPTCQKSTSTDCALIMNLFGSSGLPGQVIKIKARKRTGSTESFPDVIRFALRDHYGDDRPVSLGGCFVIRGGKANFHVMPDFPPESQLPFKDAKHLNDWLTYHDFSVASDSNGGEIVCLSVLHSADPGKKMGLRLEHTHCFSVDGSGKGGHYHYDLEDEEIEYEGYFNVAEKIFRIDRPKVTLERDLHE